MYRICHQNWRSVRTILSWTNSLWTTLRIGAPDRIWPKNKVVGLCYFLILSLSPENSTLYSLRRLSTQNICTLPFSHFRVIHKSGTSGTVWQVMCFDLYPICDVSDLSYIEIPTYGRLGYVWPIRHDQIYCKITDNSIKSMQYVKAKEWKSWLIKSLTDGLLMHTIIVLYYLQVKEFGKSQPGTIYIRARMNS